MLYGVLYLKGEILVSFMIAWIVLGTWVLDGFFLLASCAAGICSNYYLCYYPTLYVEPLSHRQYRLLTC